MPRTPDKQQAPESFLTGFYSRVTKDESVKKGLSLPAQRRRYEEIASRHGWNSRIYAEPRHVSGELPPEDRPALADILADVRAGAVRRVVIRHLDRLGRGPVLESILKELQEHGVEVRDFGGKVDFGTAAGRFTVRVQAAAGAFEVERGGERAREARRARARDGYHIGPSPYGYTSQARLQRELRDLYGPGGEERARIEAQRQIPERPGLVIDEEEAEVVRDIYRLYLDGEGTRTIANRLNAQGRRRRGGPWYWQTVQKVLRDPKVAGYTHFDEEAYEAGRPSSARIDRQTLFEAKHEAIIDRDTWRRAQAILAGRSRRWSTSRGQCRGYPLTGAVKCSRGHRMKGKSTGGKAHAYYICTRRAKTGPDTAGGCDAPPIPADRAEQAVREALSDLLGRPEHVIAVMDETNRRLASEEPSRRREQAEIEAQLRPLQERGDRLMAILEETDDRQKAQILLDRLMEMKDRVRELETRREAIRQSVVPLPTRRISKDVVAKFFDGLRQRLSDDLQRFADLVDLLVGHHGLQVVARDAYRIRVVLGLDATQVAGAGGGPGLRLVADVKPRIPVVVEGGVARPLTPEEWAEAENGKGDHICACGCGNRIAVLPKHHAPGVGIPRFVPGHHRMSMTEFVGSLNADGYLTVSQAAGELGIGENTLRRAEERGWVEPEWESWGKREAMRVYRRDDLPALRQKLAEAGFRFRDDETAMATGDAAAALGVSETTLRKWERDGRIPAVPRDTGNRRIYRSADVEAIQEALDGAGAADQRLLDAEGLVTRQQAQEMLGIGQRSMQRLISRGILEPVWRVLASSGRRRQCFHRDDAEALLRTLVVEAQFEDPLD